MPHISKGENRGSEIRRKPLNDYSTKFMSIDTYAPTLIDLNSKNSKSDLYKSNSLINSSSESPPQSLSQSQSNSKVILDDTSTRPAATSLRKYSYKLKTPSTFAGENDVASSVITGMFGLSTLNATKIKESRLDENK